MRSLFLSLALILPVVGAVTVAACSSDDSSTSSGSCTKNADCSGGEQCAFDISAGCSAQGQCKAPAGGLPFLACGCDGTGVPYVTPGFANAPVTKGTACTEDAGPQPGEDAGPGADSATDAPTDGTVPSDSGDDGGDASDAASE